MTGSPLPLPLHAIIKGYEKSENSATFTTYAYSHLQYGTGEKPEKLGWTRETHNIKESMCM